MSMTVLDLIRAITGVDCGALPLSSCSLTRPYLLERAGLPTHEGTVCLLTVPYALSRDVDLPSRNLSLYAVPRDYHLYFNKWKETLLPALREAFPSHVFALFADHSPIAEVEAAARAGLGMIGQNGLLITPVYGSFIFIGEVITDAHWEVVTGGDVSTIPTAPPPRCEGCGACLRACPAGCREENRAGCLSALTQQKGELTEQEQEALASHPLVWGCDTCQTVCPHNRRVIADGVDTPIPFFREERILTLDKARLDALSDEAFSQRAFAWRGRSVMERNLALQHQKAERSQP